MVRLVVLLILRVHLHRPPILLVLRMLRVRVLQLVLHLLLVVRLQLMLRVLRVLHVAAVLRVLALPWPLRHLLE